MKRSILDTPIEFDKNDFFSLLSLAAGYSIACQNRMGELVIGENGWNVDIKGGTIRFGESVFKSGVLGSESHESGTWLWAWENTEGGLPEIAAAPSRRAKKALAGCPEFENGKFMLDELHNGHNLSMVSCAVSDEDICYYRCPYSGGAAFVTVRGLPAEVFQPLAAQAFIKQYIEIISGFYCDHKLLLAGFLYQSGCGFEQHGSTVIADISGKAVSFGFEEAQGLRRLIDIS